MDVLPVNRGLGRINSIRNSVKLWLADSNEVLMNFKLFLFGVILLTMLIVSSGFFFKYPRNGIYLIPKGYTGDVIILFNQPDGVVPEVENGLYVYKMPENGILKVKIKGYAGIVNKSYYYVDENNERQEIKYHRITGSTDIYGKPKGINLTVL